MNGNTPATHTPYRTSDLQLAAWLLVCGHTVTKVDPGYRATFYFSAVPTSDLNGFYDLPSRLFDAYAHVRALAKSRAR